MKSVLIVVISEEEGWLDETTLPFFIMNEVA